MFMMLGRAEKAGSGVDKIVSGWKYLGWPLPTVAEEIRPDYVVLTMLLDTEPDKKTTQENDTGKRHRKTRQESPISRHCGGSKSWSSALSQSRYLTSCSIWG